MKHTTLSQAHKIRSLDKQGLSCRKIAREVGVSAMTVSRVLAGKFMLQQQQLADRMEVFTDGVVRGNGNFKFHAACPSDSNDDGHIPTPTHHALDATHEAGEKMIATADVLTELLAIDDLLERIEALGLDPDELLLTDPESDTCDGHGKHGAEHEYARRKAEVHAESWLEFMDRTEAEATGNLPAYRAHCLENEGQDVDVWSVRKDPNNFDLWGTRPAQETLI